MRLLTYSIYDIKAEAYMRPFFMANDSMAVRALGDAVADESTGIAKHAHDYRLFKVGEFDDLKGIFYTVDKPIFIADAADFLSLLQKKGQANESDK